MVLKEELKNVDVGYPRITEKLVNYVLDLYENDDEIESFFSDLFQYGCVSGMVDFLIYYNDTVHFFDVYEDEIEKLVSESMLEFGIKSRPLFIESLNGVAENIVQEKNLLSWFAFEEVAYRIWNELGLY